MPQASRAHARAAGNVERDPAVKAQEQEFKRARGAISCAECRRLKLKCDKTVPCSSCKRRGCSSICPNGSLTTGQGTRFILADTDRLHHKITEMSDRIRQLEDGLAILQSSTTREPHPLLRLDLLSIKSGLELHAANNLPEQSLGEDGQERSQSIDAFGTLAIEDSGGSKYYGSSAGSESLLLNEETVEVKQESKLHTLEYGVEELARAFPASAMALDGVDDMQDLIEGYLPLWERAEQLAHLYLEQAPWFFGAITKRQILEELLPMFYDEAKVHVPLAAESPPSQGDSPGSGISATASTFALAASKSTSNARTAHDLALLFVVFCFGALTDPTLKPPPENSEASTYYSLAKASLNLEPVLERAPSVATVQTLSLMGIYQGLVADEHSIESTWALMGLACKLAQSVGLHRDCARWKLPPAEVQKRRALFWELFITDCWQSLATGRLPSFSLPFVDCELPADPDQTMSESGSMVPSFPAWKALWGKECVSGVVEVTLQARAPKYSLILELDRKIRDVELPAYALTAPSPNSSLSETMKHFMPINYRELTLQYVHRTFFAQALKEYPTDPLRSQYAPSFLAGYRAACSLISTVREQFRINPVQIARFWVLWTHAFSSSVMLGSVVTHGGTTKTAQAALTEIRLAYDLFRSAAPYGGRAKKFLPIVQRIHDKAYAAFSQGYQRPTRDLFTACDTQNDGHDELAIFSGRTRTVATKSPSSSSSATPATNAPKRHRSQSRRRVQTNVQSPESVSSSSGSDPSRTSLSPPQTVETPPSTAESGVGPTGAFALESYGNVVHPMLVDQIRSFEGDIEAQIINTQQTFYLSNASSLEASPLSTQGYPTPEAQFSTMYPQEYEQSQEAQWRYNAEPELRPPTNGARHQVQQSSAPILQEQQRLAAVHQHPPSESYYSSQSSASPHSHASSSQSPPEHAYSVPMYGAVDSASLHLAPGQTYTAPVQATVHYPPPAAPVEPAYFDSQQRQTEGWHVPPTYGHQPQQQYASQPQEYGQYHQYHHPTPTNSRPQSVHGTYAQHHVQALPPAPAVVLPLHAQGGYSLQDSWQSFWQHELPAPPGAPGGGQFPPGRR